MNNIKKYAAWLGAGAIMLTLTTGCPATTDTTVGNVAESGVEATGNVVGSGVEATGNVVESGAEATGNVVGGAVDATGNMVDAAGNNMSEAGQAVDNSVDAGVSNLEALGDAATYTPKIKTAIGANEALNGTNINVDTLGEKNTIALRGSVSTQQQKDLAEALAKKNAPGYTIANQLVVGGAM